MEGNYSCAKIVVGQKGVRLDSLYIFFSITLALIVNEQQGYILFDVLFDVIHIRQYDKACTCKSLTGRY